MNGDHNLQTVVTCVNCKGLDNKQATGPDYDEIKDDHDPCTQESSGKLLPEEKSVEETHDYHTLIPGEDQERTSKVVCCLLYFVSACMWFTINFSSDTCTCAVSESGRQL